MLYIMRHGRTVWNMEHKLQGKTDVPLSEAGRPVVEQAAAAYRDTHIDVCYCSPLIRAVETAEIVLRGREIPIITDVRLEEMGFGICEGTTDFQDNPDNPIYPLFAAPETYRIPVEGGESLEDLYARGIFERSDGAAAAAGKGHPDRGPRRHEREHCVPDQGHPREGLLEREDEKRGAGAAALSASL